MKPLSSTSPDYEPGGKLKSTFSIETLLSGPGGPKGGGQEESSVISGLILNVGQGSPGGPGEGWSFCFTENNFRSLKG